MAGLIGLSSGKIMYFHCTKHAITRWPHHLSLVLLLLLEVYSKKKVAYQRRAQVMGFDPNAYKLMKDPAMTLANHHFWGVSLKQDLMGLMIPKI